MRETRDVNLSFDLHNCVGWQTPDDLLTYLIQAIEQGDLIPLENRMIKLEEHKLAWPVVEEWGRGPDAYNPYSEIGFGIPHASAQGKGFATEVVGLLIDELFASYPVERIMAFTEQGNLPARQVLEGSKFQQEGRLRRSMFRDGQWRDIMIYGILRQEAQKEQKASS